MTFKIFTGGPEATIKLGERVGALLVGGEVIELSGDLGAGKTTLMKGVLSGLGYEGDVPSPTYTISRVYQLKNNLELHHFDFYRIHGNDVVVSELAEVANNSTVIVAMEWSSNILDDALPKDRIIISFDLGHDDSSRNITIASTSKKYEYVVNGLSN